MTFVQDKVEDFQRLFEERKEKIRNRPGCLSLRLLQEQKEGNIFFTISEWESEVDLEAYRDSELFKETWKLTKAMFAERAKAWSTSSQHMI